ncbi:MAG TPA: DegT/DnrJ/EryC1/StrS aminotransferase family protein [Gemmatimonadaceae bacterium]
MKEAADVRREFLPFAPPCVGEEEIAEVAETLRSPWITTGPRAQRFEQRFAEYLGAPGALALNSCTAGLHVALAAYGIGPGDEVITTTLTFVATVNVIEHVGARPVLVDVLPDTLNLDPRGVEAALTARTRAIIPVHYAGHPVDLDAIRALADARGLVVIEDAAHALPASYRGVRIGAGDNPVAFSFYATKNLTTAEGGMLTGGAEFLDRARMLSLHGMSHDAWRRYAKGGRWHYEVVAPGFKYNLSDVQAAIGLRQLDKLEAFQRRRRDVARRYTAAFSVEPALEPPVEQPHVEHAWHLYVLRLRLEALRIDRDRFLEELAARNIGASVHFIPVHLHRYYREKYGWTPECHPVSYAHYQRMLSLPLHPGLSDADVDDVIEAVRDVVDTYRR